MARGEGLLHSRVRLLGVVGQPREQSRPSTRGSKRAVRNIIGTLEREEAPC